MMKVVIVHGSNFKDRENRIKYHLPPQNKRDWISWVKKELEARGIECITPLMPENWNPKYENWKKELEKIKFNEEDILVGHSAGGGFLVRWLGETEKRIKRLILVAPAIRNRQREGWELKEFYNFKINEEIKKNVQKIILIQSDNDSESILESCKIYSNTLKLNQLF